MDKESEIVEQLKAINKNLEQIAKNLDSVRVELNRIRGCSEYHPTNVGRTVVHRTEKI